MCDTCMNSYNLQRDIICGIAVIWVKISRAEKTIEIQLVRPTEVGGKV